MGDTLTVVGTAYAADGTVIPAKIIHWHSSDTSVVQVDSSGLAYGRNGGSALITASIQGVKGSATITVYSLDTGWRSIENGCGVWNDDRVYCWYLGFSPAPVPGTEGRIRSVDRRLYHACALNEQGAAFCWGENDFGQLGDGTSIDSANPVRVAGGLIFESIATGGLHTCALTRDGDAYCWGSGRAGQLGTANVLDDCGMPCSRTPVRVAGNIRFRMIAAGGFDRPDLSGFGLSSTCGISETGVAYCWGYNGPGNLGDGTRIDRNVPTAVLSANRFSTIAVGAQHTCAIALNKRLYCWGSNFSRQLGLTTPSGPEYLCTAGDLAWTCSSVPLQVETTERMSSVSAGTANTCALNWYGAAFCWGTNRRGEVGNGLFNQEERIPTRVAGGHTYLQIRTGHSSSCALRSDRIAECWGNGNALPQAVASPLHK